LLPHCVARCTESARVFLEPSHRVMTDFIAHSTCVYPKLLAGHLATRAYRLRASLHTVHNARKSPRRLKWLTNSTRNLIMNFNRPAFASFTEHPSALSTSRSHATRRASPRKASGLPEIHFSRVRTASRQIQRVARGPLCDRHATPKSQQLRQRPVASASSCLARSDRCGI